MNGNTALLSGRLDTAAAPQVQDALSPLSAHASETITLDCSALEYISSSGLRVFLMLRKAAAAAGGKVVVKGISEDIRAIFMMTGFINLFEFE